MVQVEALANHGTEQDLHEPIRLCRSCRPSSHGPIEEPLPMLNPIEHDRGFQIDRAMTKVAAAEGNVALERGLEASIEVESVGPYKGGEVPRGRSEGGEVKKAADGGLTAEVGAGIDDRGINDGEGFQGDDPAGGSGDAVVEEGGGGSNCGRGGGGDEEDLDRVALVEGGGGWRRSTRGAARGGARGGVGGRLEEDDGKGVAGGGRRERGGSGWRRRRGRGRLEEEHEEERGIAGSGKKKKKIGDGTDG